MNTKPSVSTYSLPSVHPIITCQELIEDIESEVVPQETNSQGEFIGHDSDDLMMSASQGMPPVANNAQNPAKPTITPSEKMKKTIEMMQPRDEETPEEAHKRFCQIIDGFDVRELSEYVCATNKEVSTLLAPIEQEDEEITENVEKLKAIRREGVEQLNLGGSNIGNLTTTNPIIQAAYEFEEALAEKFEDPEVCMICMESGYDKAIGLRTKKCSRCADEFRGHKLEGVNPKSFSMENKMIPLDIPPELQNLSFAEQKIISLANPLLFIYSRKGLSTLRGNCIGKYYSFSL